MNDYEIHNALLPGSWLNGKYQIAALLGHGGFGNTYRAYDAEHNRMVAIKELYPASFVSRDYSSRKVAAHSGREAVFESYKEKFRKEAQIMYELRSHPEILDVYAYFAYGGTEYYAMELLEGENLKEYLVHNGQMTWEQFAPVLRGILLAVKVLHREGYIHRDIKPDNVFLTRNGKIYLIDYGNVRDFAHADHFTEQLTDHFAPPEQYLSNSSQGPYTDIYSLCATVYYCLSAKLPPVAVSRMAEKAAGGKDSLIPLKKLVKNVPDFVSEAVQKGLEDRMKDRFQTVGELEAALFPKKAEPKPEPITRSGRAIRCIYGMMKGNVFEVPKETNFSVGRVANICYPERAVGISRIQFYLFVDKFGYAWIYDPGSTNGVSVGNEKIPQKKWKQILVGQIISFVSEVYELV